MSSTINCKCRGLSVRVRGGVGVWENKGQEDESLLFLPISFPCKE